MARTESDQEFTQRLRAEYPAFVEDEFEQRNRDAIKNNRSKFDKIARNGGIGMILLAAAGVTGFLIHGSPNSAASATLEAKPGDNTVVEAVLKSPDALRHLGMCANRLSYEAKKQNSLATNATNTEMRADARYQFMIYTAGAKVAEQNGLVCPDKLPTQEYQIEVGGEWYNVSPTIIATHTSNLGS